LLILNNKEAEMSVIEFPKKMRDERSLSSFDDLVTTSPEIDERAAELKSRALDTVHQFPPEAIAEVLAYAAARLERVGFKMFRP
jgi:hypothetical protein